jgi:hypothetical protein
MSRFIGENSRTQLTLFAERLEDYVASDIPIRVIDAFVDGLDLGGLKFKRVNLL